ncbi:hypothetical protein CEQ90_17630 [Lewinellaceae bacterium SD302]|nr:hypothetical protein CEQ90_17630 [Lewinellaceae bacterium SD302]
MLAQQSNNTWVLQVRAALTAFDYVVEDQYGKNAYNTPEEFRQLVLQHVRKNITIHCDNADVAVFKEGRVSLGHETNVTFLITGIAENTKSLNISNTSFSKLPHNQSALMVLKEGYTKKQFILSNDNGHTANLEVGEAEFNLVEASIGKTILPSVSLLFIALALGALSYFFINKKESTLSLIA